MLRDWSGTHAGLEQARLKRPQRKRRLDGPDTDVPRRLFERFNRDRFDGRLPPIGLRISRGMTRSLGTITYETNGPRGVREIALCADLMLPENAGVLEDTLLHDNGARRGMAGARPPRSRNGLAPDREAGGNARRERGRTHAWRVNGGDNDRPRRSQCRAAPAGAGGHHRPGGGRHRECCQLIAHGRWRRRWRDSRQRRSRDPGGVQTDPPRPLPGRLARGRGGRHPSGALPAGAVIHTVGPRWRGGGAGEPERLASAYRSSLELAAEHGWRTVAFPSISTGVYGYPVGAAARVALAAILDVLREWPEAFDEVRVVLFFVPDLAEYRRALSEKTGGEVNGTITS